MKKRYILMILLLLVFIILSIYIIFIKKENVVYLGDSNIVTIKNGDIVIKKDNELSYLKEAKIYYNDSFIDGYIRTVKDNSYEYNIREAITKDNKKILFSDSLLAYTGNIKIKVGTPVYYNILTNSEKEELLNIAEENKIDGEISSASRVDFDIDGDKELEKVYSYTINNTKKISTITVLIKGTENEILDIQSGVSKYPSRKESWFYKFIDFNKDDVYEIVLYKSNGDDALGEFKIYTYNSGSIAEIK